MNSIKFNMNGMLVISIFILVQLIFAFALGLFQFQPSAQLVPDSEDYLKVLGTISNHYTPNAVRTIGYPMLLFIMQRLASFISINFYSCVFFVQFVMYAISVTLWMKVVEKMHSKKWAHLFVFFLALNPSLVYYTYIVSTEISFLFFISIAFYFLFQFYERKQYLYIVLALVCFSIATLIRPGFYYFNLLFFIGLLAYMLFYKKNIFYAVLTVLIYGFFILKNQAAYYEYHGMFKLSIIDEITQYRYLTNRIQCIEGGLNLQENLALLDSNTNAYVHSNEVLGKTLKLNNYYEKVNQANFNKNYIISLRALAENFFSNFHVGNSIYPRKNDNFLQKEFYNITRIFNMFFVVLLMFVNVLGIIAFLRKRKNLLWLSLILILYANYIIITSSVSFWQGDRFNIVWYAACLSACIQLLVDFKKKVN